MNQKSEKEEKEGSDSPIGARLEEIAKSGGVTAKSDGETIHCLSIIGQIEGHYVLDQTQKTTKYEHLIPLLCAVEESREIDGLLLILNTMGGDVEAGLAIAEMVASMKKPAVTLVLGGAASGSPYAGVGLSREMVTIISCELPLVLVLLSVAKTVGDAMGTGLCFSLTDIALYQAANGSLILKASMIPAAAAMLLIIPGETGNHPFDAAEAETEICEGMLAEYSGAPLGVYKLNHAIKMLTLTSLFAALFLGGIGGGIEKLVALIGLTGGAAAGMTMLLGIVILLLLCIALTAVSISFVHAITARLKIEQIFKYYWTVVSGLALISLVLAWYGM